MKKLFMILFLILGMTLIGCGNKTPEITTSKDTFTLQFIYDNKALKTEEVQKNAFFKDPKIFLENKIFKGFYFDAELTDKVNIKDYRIQKDQIFYLKYEAKRSLNVLYIPLDNRPVNKERVQLLSKAADTNLMLPEEDLYRTYLDNQLLNSNGTKIGNPAGLLSYIKAQNHDEIDGYILSLDQLNSGGLVGSRANYDPELKDEIKIMEELIQIIEDKPLYLIDTVMRLASTTGFDGYTEAEYNGLRQYGMTARPVLNMNDLTLENIQKNYSKNSSNQEISLPKGITEAMKDRYLTARYRKISLTSKILSLINQKNTYYICGIDDSSNGINIQTNEINYIKKFYPNVNLFPGTDELGLMCLSKFYMDQTNYTPLTAKMTFFGTNYNEPDTTYDGLNFNQNIQAHLKSLGINLTTGNDFDFEVLALTSKTNDTYANNLTKKLEINLKNDIPTCIIDGNSISTTNRKILPKYLLQVNNLGKLLGYSSWNTAGNTIGISLSMISTRLSYLKSDYSRYQNQSSENFINMLTFALVKDITYKAFVGNEMASYINSNAKDQNGKVMTSASSNFYQYLPYSPDFNLFLSDKMKNYPNFNAEIILQQLKNDEVYSSLHEQTNTQKIDEIKIQNYVFPWYRHYEIKFDVTTHLKTN